jgi:hypothetical protein
MLGSNQRPLPCEGSKACAVVYRHIPKMRVHKPISRLKHTSLLRSLPPFYARVAARLLHRNTLETIYPLYRARWAKGSMLGCQHLLAEVPDNLWVWLAAWGGSGFGGAHRLRFDPHYPGVTAGLQSIGGNSRLLLACRVSNRDGSSIGVAFTALIPCRTPKVSVSMSRATSMA